MVSTFLQYALYSTREGFSTFSVLFPLHNRLRLEPLRSHSKCRFLMWRPFFMLQIQNPTTPRETSATNHVPVAHRQAEVPSPS
jgi:hypothetical protein